MGDLGRVGEGGVGGVAGDAEFVEHGFAIGCGRLACGCGSSCAGSGGIAFLYGRGGEVAAGLVGHIGHGTGNFVIGEGAVAAARGHLACAVEAVYGVGNEGVEAFGDAGAPFVVVGNFGGEGNVFIGTVALDADFVEHLLAFAFAYGRAVAHGEAADGLDTGFHGAGLHIGNVAVVAGGGELNQEEEGDQQNEQAADKGSGG